MPAYSITKASNVMVVKNQVTLAQEARSRGLHLFRGAYQPE